EPNLQFELDQFAEKTGQRVTFNKEAREKFLSFALSSGAVWLGNFRDLNAALVRMATLAKGGRISLEIVEEEILRLTDSLVALAGSGQEDDLRGLVGPKQLQEMDLFDRLQLSKVVAVCRDARTLSDAGRTLFNVSRERRATANDADRLRKYLQRFGLEWSQL